MRTSIIVAKTKNNVIGKDNDLVWHLPDDMKFFQQKTKGHTVIMGRKNYYSLPPKFRPLPNRENIVMTTQEDWTAEGVQVVHSLEEALEKGKSLENQELFVIGGGKVFAQALDKVDRMYITEIDAELEGDTWFPEFDRSKWKETSREHHPQDERHAYAFDFVQYDRY